jgi:hypothetical protein
LPYIRGARKGNKHALKHGRYTAEELAERARLRGILRQARAAIEEAKALLRERRVAGPGEK